MKLNLSPIIEQQLKHKIAQFEKDVKEIVAAAELDQLEINMQFDPHATKVNCVFERRLQGGFNL